MPSRPKHPAQPLALDVGSPRAALVTGTWINFELIARHKFAPSNRPGLLARPMRVRLYLLALASCAVRERQGGPSRGETQGCAADGTADGPELWCAATSAVMW